MNAINRLELALYRSASQMGDRDGALFKLVAQEMEALAHDADDTVNMALLNDYRKTAFKR